MTTIDEQQLKTDIAHIFESGANEVRVFEMVKSFTERRGVMPSFQSQQLSENSQGLYPELSSRGQQEAMKLMEDFKKQAMEISNKAIGDLYCDVLPHIQTDAWVNIRTSILNEICNYRNSSTSPYDYKRIREAIYSEHKEQIDKDLNQDLLNQIESLKKDLRRAYDRH